MYSAVCDGTLNQDIGLGIDSNVAGTVNKSVINLCLGEEGDGGRCGISYNWCWGRHLVNKSCCDC